MIKKKNLYHCKFLNKFYNGSETLISHLSPISSIGFIDCRLFANKSTDLPAQVRKLADQDIYCFMLLT